MKTLMLVLSLSVASLGASAIAQAEPKADAQPRRTRLVPNTRAGQPHGWKVFAIQSGSIYQKAGFENGDTLLEIDAKPVTSATPDPLEAAVKAASVKATAITISIERRTEPRTLTLTLTSD